MARPGKPSLFDRRLNELQQERERVEGTIKDLSKAIRRFETTGEPVLPPPPMKPGPRYQRTTLSSSARSPEPPARTFGETSLGQVSTTPLLEPAMEAEAEPPAGAAGDLLPGFKSMPEDRRKAVPRTEKFANYLASGSFGKAGRPMAQEKRLQRNKAIFMLVFAIVALFVLFRVIFK